MSTSNPLNTPDQVFSLRDGFYCTVGGRVHGPWPDIGTAKAGLEVEQRRAAARRAKEG